MTVVEPIDIYDSVVIDYNEIDSADEALPEWDNTKADYTTGDEVKVLADRKKYKCASDTVSAGTVPKDNPDIWVESPLLEYAMFNYNNEYASSFTGDYIVTIPNAVRIDTLFFQDIDGDDITVELYDSSDVLLETLEDDIYEWEIKSFGDYLFPTTPVKKSKIQFDFLHLDLDYIKITISGTTTQCRYCVTGTKDQLGLTLRDGIGYSQNNFYALERDAWGNLISTNQRLIEDASLPVIDYNEDVGKNANKTSRLFGSPCLWIADDRDKKQVEFPFINIFGVLTSNSITPSMTVSEKILKIEGK